eukprot:2080740-Prymnesium_polylepis.1
MEDVLVELGGEELSIDCFIQAGGDYFRPRAMTSWDVRKEIQSARLDEENRVKRAEQAAKKRDEQTEAHSDSTFEVSTGGIRTYTNLRRPGDPFRDGTPSPWAGFDGRAPSAPGSAPGADAAG